MHVYVVQQGMYEDQHVIAIHRTLKGAKKDRPAKTWVDDGLGGVDNGLDWDEYITIDLFELED